MINEYQPKDIDDCDLKENEVKILQSLYDTENGKFLGLKYFVGSIILRNDPDVIFFYYGYKSEGLLFAGGKKKNTKLFFNFNFFIFKKSI